MQKCKIANSKWFSFALWPFLVISYCSESQQPLQQSRASPWEGPVTTQYLNSAVLIPSKPPWFFWGIGMVFLWEMWGTIFEIMKPGLFGHKLYPSYLLYIVVSIWLSPENVTFWKPSAFRAKHPRKLWRHAAFKTLLTFHRYPTVHRSQFLFNAGTADVCIHDSTM